MPGDNETLDLATLTAIESITSAMQTKMMEQLEARLAALSLNTPSGLAVPPPQALQSPSHPPEKPPAPAPAPNPSTGLQVHPQPSITGGVQLGFIPPLSGNSPNGTSESLSLDHPFPHVEEATITSIISHTFNPYHLWKLDPRHHERNHKKTLQLVGGSLEIASDETALKDYKDIASLVVPLNVYFEILVHYSSPSVSGAIAILFFRYLGHLHKIATEYSWSAVVSYHAQFFLRRRAEMRKGLYNLWARQDPELASEFLHAHRKAVNTGSLAPSLAKKARAGTVCQNFNNGKCTSATCPWNRLHTCSVCGKSDHNAQTHPKAM